MRVAVVSDVHGNLPALEAVLAELDREGVDAIVCCGDVYQGGPLGDECRARLEQVGASFVKGNADEVAEHDWPLTLTFEIDRLGQVLFCHGSPRSEHEIITRVSPETRLEEVLSGVVADVVVHGHTHVQYDRRVAGRRLVCPGSVGMPYEGVRGAFWAVLGPDVELRRTEYDAQEEWLRETSDPDEVSAYFEEQAGS
jgi:putative phosphoesterase